jgi:SAM-dependent methyltransferase
MVTGSEDFRLPASAEYYVSLQRTASQSPLYTLAHRLGAGAFYDTWLRRPIERRRRNRIAHAFTQSIMSDYQSMQPYLPLSASHILDIGCGLGGIDLMLYRHFGDPELWLLDREGHSRLFYGYRDVAAHYNSLAASRSFLVENGVPDERIHTVDVDSAGFPGGDLFDLVVSLLSWGFHYPLETYLANVAENLEPEGRVITDVRQGTAGQELMRTRFAEVTPIHIGEKYTRLAAAIALAQA